MAVSLYARVSTTRQAEQDLSIPDQLRQLREWCAAGSTHRDGIRRTRRVRHGRQTAGIPDPDGGRPATPPPFDTIVVHSLSRFFRDGITFGLYERKLQKHGVQVVSITQQTSDDASGQMVRRMISMFDEYQSSENAKHTGRAMRENARQGFFNGSAAPFGYQAVATERARQSRPP